MSNTRRSREGGDPYRVISRLGGLFDAFCYPLASRLCVPAFDGLRDNA